MATYEECKEHLKILLERKDRHIFLYGCSRTGKSYMCNEIKDDVKNNMFIVVHEQSFFANVIADNDHQLLGGINTFNQLDRINEPYYLIDMNHIRNGNVIRTRRNHKNDLIMHQKSQYPPNHCNILSNIISLQSKQEFDLMNNELKGEYRYPITVEEQIKMEKKYEHAVSFREMYELFVDDIYIPKDILKVIVECI
jgi:hypothetical protein